MTNNTKKIEYTGSANSIPRYNLTFKDGDILELPEKLADRLVSQNCGFAYAEKTVKKKEEKVKEDGRPERI